jgi:hypothetical protein
MIVHRYSFPNILTAARLAEEVITCTGLKKFLALGCALPWSWSDWQVRLTAMEAYKFAPLQHPDSIRLLTLHSGVTSAPIQISLSEVWSGDDPQYEALSYTWATENGDITRSPIVECDGEHIKVTNNCTDALRRLRYKDIGCMLWVDAICLYIDRYRTNTVET